MQAELHVISNALPVTGCHIWFLTHPDKRQCLDHSNRVAWHRKYRYSRWIFVAIMYHVYKLIYVISNLLQADNFDFSLTHTSFCTNIRPTMLFDATSGLSVSGFMSAFLISGWTRIELCTGRCSYQQRDFGVLKNKRSNVELSSKGDLRPLIQWSPSLSHFHQKIIHHTFTSGDVMGWNISKISTSSHYALMAVGIRRNAMENSDGKLKCSRKTRGLQLFRLNIAQNVQVANNSRRVRVLESNFDNAVFLLRSVQMLCKAKLVDFLQRRRYSCRMLTNAMRLRRIRYSCRNWAHCNSVIHEPDSHSLIFIYKCCQLTFNVLLVQSQLHIRIYWKLFSSPALYKLA